MRKRPEVQPELSGRDAFSLLSDLTSGQGARPCGIPPALDNISCKSVQTSHSCSLTELPLPQDQIDHPAPPALLSAGPTVAQDRLLGPAGVLQGAAAHRPA